MKIDFNDGSFILIEPGKDNDLSIVMCGRKDHNTVSMSSSSVKREQVEKIFDFLRDWLSKNKSVGV